MSLLVFQKIAEERIKEALENGELEAPSCKGKPLDLKEDPFVPEDLRLVYKILKNAGFLPKEVELMKEIKRIEELLEKDTKEAYLRVRKLNALIFKLNQMRKVPLNLEKSEYYSKVAEKIRLAKEEKVENPGTINWSRLQVHLYISSISPRKR